MLPVRIQKSLQKDPVLLCGKAESNLEWDINVYHCCKMNSQIHCVVCDRLIGFTVVK